MKVVWRIYSQSLLKSSCIRSFMRLMYDCLMSECVNQWWSSDVWLHVTLWIKTHFSTHNLHEHCHSTFLMYNVVPLIMNSSFLLQACLCVDTEAVSVMEGGSVILNTGVQTNQQKQITWYYNGICIALITGDLRKISTDAQCKSGKERFRNRLKLDRQTGSLNILNIRNTHSGDYTLEIIRRSSRVTEKIFRVSVRGESC